MPMRIAPGEKFACFAFTFYGVADNVPEELQVGPRLWAVRKLDLELDALRDANFALYTTMPSSKPKSLDDENRLVETLNQFLYGVLFHGVQADEALVKPEPEKTRNQFAHRISQTFTLANDETRAILLQLFDLRSYVEHMHWVIDALEGEEAGRIATVNRGTRQIDVLARAALLRVMQSDALMDAFRSDATIDAFWRMGDDERVGLWGQRLDIRTVG